MGSVYKEMCELKGLLSGFFFFFTKGIDLFFLQKIDLYSLLSNRKSQIVYPKQKVGDSEMGSDG